MAFPVSAGLTRKLLALLLLSNILLLLFFIGFDYQLIFHSDSAVKNLLAQEMVETGRFFPREWNYVNNDLWVFFNHAFIVPLLAFMPNGFAAHAASDVISAALLLWASWKVSGVLGQSPTARLVSMIVLSSGMSEIMAEHVFGQAAYGAAYYLGCFLLVAYWSLTQAQGRARWGWGAATAVLAALVFWANPQRAMIYYGLPLLLAGGTLWALDRQAGAPGAGRRHGCYLGVLMAGLVVGVALNSYTLRQVINHRGLTAMNWLSYDGMVHNVHAIIGGLFGILGGEPRAATRVVSIPGVYQILRLLAAVTVMVLAPLALRRALRSAHRGRLFVAVFASAMLGLNLLIMLTTTLADMSAPTASVRYLVPGVLLLLMLTVGEVVDRPSGSLPARAAAVLALALLATSAAPSYLSPYNQHFKLPPAINLPSPENNLLDYLRANGLHYGYASFWNAGKLTVLSGHEVKVRQVVIEGGVPMPMRKLASNRWYQPAAWSGPTFLMLTQGELAQVDLARLAAEVGAPQRTLRHGDMTILVYPANLAVMQSWNPRVSAPTHFPVSERSPHHTGHYDAKAGALVGEAGTPGWLHYGPYIDIEPGRYAVSFDLETGAAPAGAELGAVDVVAAAGVTSFARRTVTGSGRQLLTLQIDVREPTKLLEFRVLTNGISKMLVYQVSLVRLPA
ncbi:hypothetical protein [Massilia sp. Root418]|jgi:hypothetical protein|uniref:hypothetical protein n=1 Tax=Massilia sp. Root418 TaxID=1736532 RepID=UPI000AAC53E5|nr:hypothetical protein [Massilia sp. Root418]